MSGPLNAAKQQLHGAHVQLYDQYSCSHVYAYTGAPAFTSCRVREQRRRVKCENQWVYSRA